MTGEVTAQADQIRVGDLPISVHVPRKSQTHGDATGNAGDLYFIRPGIYSGNFRQRHRDLPNPRILGNPEGQGQDCALCLRFIRLEPQGLFSLADAHRPVVLRKILVGAAVILQRQKVLVIVKAKVKARNPRISGESEGKRHRLPRLGRNGVHGQRCGFLGCRGVFRRFCLLRLVRFLMGSLFRCLCGLLRHGCLCCFGRFGRPIRLDGYGRWNCLLCRDFLRRLSGFGLRFRFRSFRLSGFRLLRRFIGVLPIQGGKAQIVVLCEGLRGCAGITQKHRLPLQGIRVDRLNGLGERNLGQLSAKRERTGIQSRNALIQNHRLDIAPVRVPGIAAVRLCGNGAGTRQGQLALFQCPFALLTPGAFCGGQSVGAGLPVCTAVVLNIVLDSGIRVAIDDCRNVKSPVPYPRHTIRHIDRSQFCAVREGPFPDTDEAIGETDPAQAGAVFKRACANIAQGLG